MDIETFLNLPTSQVAQLVREAGPKVCVFPINGTRRWFMLEHPQALGENLETSYLEITGQRYIEVYQLFFDHGIDILLSPIFGPDLLERGKDYMAAVSKGMARLATHPDFLTFYQDYDVNVRFYGDHRKYLAETPDSYLSDLFEEVTTKTQSHTHHQLLFGVFAHDATETIADLSVQYYQKHNHVPKRETLVKLYYGDYIPPVDFFIGFDKFSAFDMPLVSIGQEDLYFTIAPSLYLNEPQLRHILYDHLYARPEEETDYSDLTSEDWGLMYQFYHLNRHMTLGVGTREKPKGFWYPLPQVELPQGFRNH